MGSRGGRVEARVSPILVRPVREQLEHDRVIRVLQGRFKKRYDVGINPGAEQNASIGTGASAVFPDLVLWSRERGRRVEGIVEVETSESINNLEAMAQWARFAKLKPAFHLYVPASAVDPARRMCQEHGIAVAELWSYHTIADQLRFTMMHRAPVTRPVESGRRVHSVAAVRKTSRSRSAAPRGRAVVRKSVAGSQKRR
jgi:hypothetical protein